MLEALQFVLPFVLFRWAMEGLGFFRCALIFLTAVLSGCLFVCLIVCLFPLFCSRDGCQNPDFRTPVWLDRQRSSSVSALLRRRSSGSSASGNSSVGSFGIWNVSTGAAFSVLALGLLSQLTGAGNTSLRNVYGMSPQRSPSVLCCRLARSSAQDSDVFFVAFSIAVDLKLKVFLLLCCLLDRGRSQAQGISLFGRSAVLRICEGRSVERDN